MTLYGSLTMVTATIANGASLSGAVDIGSGLSLVGIVTPAGWTTAVVSFQASTALDGTYVDLYKLDGTEMASPGSLAASHWHPLDPADFAGVRYLKVRSGTAAAAVNQAGGDTLTLVVRSL